VDTIKHIDKEDQRYVTTDFKDQILKPLINEKDYALTGNDDAADYSLPTDSPFEKNGHRLEKIIRENATNITIQRIRQGEKITKEELKSLENILFNGQLKKEELEKELGNQLNLVEFIIQLIGLSKAHVDKAFANFINDYQLTSVQIEFLETLKKFVTRNGRIDPVKLFDPPFNRFHPHGIEGVFKPEMATRLNEIVERINQSQIT
jgi:type I restriction enzyme R subunit